MLSLQKTIAGCVMLRELTFITHQICVFFNSSSQWPKVSLLVIIRVAGVCIDFSAYALMFGKISCRCIPDL